MIGDFCKKMYHMVERNNPITGKFNGVRIIMFFDDDNVKTPVDRNESSNRTVQKE